MIGLAPKHHAIGPGELTNYLPGRAQAAVEDHRYGRETSLERLHDVVAQRRNLPVVTRRPGAEHRLASMHDDGVAPRGHDSADEFRERGLLGVAEPGRRFTR